MEKKTASPLLYAGSLILIVLAIYANVLYAPLQWDEKVYIANNPIVKDLNYFLNPAKAHGIEYYDSFMRRYVGYLTFAVNYRLHGLYVAGYHIVNIAIHIANSISVYFLMLLTFRTPFFRDRGPGARDQESGNPLPVTGPRSPVPEVIAFFSAAIFAVHPLQTEAVTYVFQRFASLAAFFFLLSLTAYIKSRLAESKWKRVSCYGISLFSAVLAMKTKENAFTLPLIITLYECSFFKGAAGKRMLFLMPVLLTMLIIPLSLMNLTGLHLDPGTYGSAKFSRGEYLFTQVRVVMTYLRLFFLPVNQNISYDYHLFKSFFDPQVLSSFVFLTALFGLGVYFMRKQVKAEVKSEFPSAVAQPGPQPQPALRFIGFGVLWFFITLSVESSIVPIPMLVDEYRMYLPSIGIIMSLVTGTFMVSARRPAKADLPLPVFLVIIVGLLSVAAYQRNELWRDPVRLWEDASRKSPLYAEAHNNLGLAYLAHKRYDRAMEQYLIAVKLKPDFAEAHNNLGLVYQTLKQFDKAIGQYRIAINLRPYDARPYNNLGLVYQTLNMPDKAVEQYLIAINRRPNEAEAHINLGSIYQALGRTDNAMEQYSVAVRLRPDFSEAHFDLALIFCRKGQIESARRELEEALKLSPDDLKARQLLRTIKN